MIVAIKVKFRNKGILNKQEKGLQFKLKRLRNRQVIVGGNFKMELTEWCLVRLRVPVITEQTSETLQQNRVIFTETQTSIGQLQMMMSPHRQSLLIILEEQANKILKLKIKLKENKFLRHRILSYQEENRRDNNSLHNSLVYRCQIYQIKQGRQAT